MSTGADQRFHLDQDGHSITVVRASGGRRIELLVDGRLVAAARTNRHAPTELRGELADSGGPRPFTVRVGRCDIPGGEPLCTLEAGGKSYLMPLLPLTRAEQWPAEHTPSPRTPAELLTRWRDHWRRRRPG
ncbi:hypothetical protein [Streptomyces sp. NBC_01565]|uniref:hypothetical protein n=1 Tax=unclassified Streptomyces TaxID=2593676 RepID=UPI0022502A8C|nr:hypothetical protein [Streptomyces sp. NBC_01565]MCX4539283.1 hypothetical protein [Streptomyces sp. NBC_01565]